MRCATVAPKLRVLRLLSRSRKFVTILKNGGHIIEAYKLLSITVLPIAFAKDRRVRYATHEEKKERKPHLVDDAFEWLYNTQLYDQYFIAVS